MSLTQKKLRVKTAPRSKESVAGGKYLMDLLAQGDDLDYPQRQIAQLDTRQLANLDTVQGYLDNGTEGENLAMSEFSKILNGGYDPRTSDYYKGFRQEAEAMKADEAANIRRRGQLGMGTMQTSPNARLEADNARRYDNMVLQELGTLTENERNREMTAASGAASIGQNKINNQINTANLMDMPRQITQEEYNAQYEETMNELLAPYNVIAPIALRMMNYNPGYYAIGGGTKDWIKDIGVITGMAGGLMGAGAI